MAFAGTVVNDLGEPLTAFEIVADSTRDGGPSETQAFEDPDGRFQFTRAGPGEWELSVKTNDSWTTQTYLGTTVTSTTSRVYMDGVETVTTDGTVSYTNAHQQRRGRWGC